MHKIVADDRAKLERELLDTHTFAPGAVYVRYLVL